MTRKGGAERLARWKARQWAAGRSWELEAGSGPTGWEDGMYERSCGGLDEVVVIPQSSMPEEALRWEPETL